MTKLRFLITAGPTQEPIDPVRYLSNYSSGKMGYALAEAALQKGHHVTLISGPTSLVKPTKAHVIPVTTALEMHRAVMKHYRKADVIIKTAAVADYRPVKQAKQKIKKSKKGITLKLVRNPDILFELGTRKHKNQILVGFAAETRQIHRNALHKLKKKNCDWIVLNNVARKGIGFGSDYNKVFLLSQKGRMIPLPRMTKKNLASKIINVILT